MNKITLIVRTLLGFVFVASGVAFFMMKPPPLEGPMADFFNGMMATGYFFYLLKGTEILCGLLLLSGYFVPLALVILAPIVLNIFLIHVFLAHEGLVVAIGIGLMTTYLAFFSKEYSPRIKSLFVAH